MRLSPPPTPTTLTGEAGKVPKLDTAGRLRLGANPLNVLDAATKQYVDALTPTGLVRVLNQSGVTLSIISTTVEEDMVNYSVPGGTIGTDGLLRMTVMLSLYNNTGVNQTITLRWRWATTLMYSDILTLTPSVSVRPMIVELWLGAQNNTQTQFSHIRLARDLSADPLGYLGALGPLTYVEGHYVGIPADSTVAQALRMTVQPGVNSANLGAFRRQYAIEKVGA